MYSRKCRLIIFWPFWLIPPFTANTYRNWELNAIGKCKNLKKYRCGDF